MMEEIQQERKEDDDLRFITHFSRLFIRRDDFRRTGITKSSQHFIQSWHPVQSTERDSHLSELQNVV